MISSEGVALDPEKVKAVVEWTRPTSMFKIWSFLGLAGYYRRFIEGFSKLSGPLTTLTKKNACFVWTDKCEHSFQELKKRLVTTPVLALPTESSNFVVYSDASKKGLGCMLMQWQCYCLCFTPPEVVLAELSYTQLGVGNGCVYS
jgi:hypothetical protein